MAKKSKKKISRDTMMKIGIGVVFVVIVAAVLLLSGGEPAQEKADEEEVQETAKPVVEEKVSFDKYLDNIESYKNTEVTLKGRLRMRVEEGTGVSYYEVVDDFGNAVMLSRMDNEQKQMFSESPTEKHEVRGILKASWSKVFMDVKDIS